MPPGDKIYKLEDKVQVEIGIRLQLSCDIWETLDRVKLNSNQKKEIASIMRLAYGSGYIDALTEPVRGQMFKSLGQKIPKRGK